MTFFVIHSESKPMPRTFTPADWEDVARRFRFDPITGAIYAKSGSVRLDRQYDHRGYHVLSCNSRQDYAHRIVWFLATGRLVRELDHINGVKSDNRPENLRDATRSQNNLNPNNVLMGHNTSSHRGVDWNKASKKWRARLEVGGKSKSLGYFETIEEAIAARRRAESELAGSL